MMKPAKIITSISVLLFLYMVFIPQTGTGPLLEILKESTVSITPVLYVLKLAPIIGLFLNLAYLAVLFGKSSKNQELKRSVFFSLLLLIIPIGAFYLSILFINYNIYNLASVP